MKFKLVINLENDAFNEPFGATEFEINRILEELQNTLADFWINGMRKGLLRDINGNKVGNWEVI